MLDNGNTDWIYGNSVGMALSPRSFANPNMMGDHYDVNSNSIFFGGGQPDTYNGTYWYNGTNLNIDRGGVHINSGVQNHWFYILSNGESGTNDIGDIYNVSGIGMDKSSKIAYLALTSMLMSTSQYSDSRLATIQAAKALFGECSQEYRSTVDAWYAVGIGSLNTCPPLSVKEIESTIKIYPNPTHSFFSIETGNQIDGEILIFDIHGRLLKTVNPNSTKNINVSEFSNGVYTVVFSINGKQISKKIIIQ